MKVITHIAILFYLAIITLVATLAVSFATHSIHIETWIYFLSVAYQDQNICLIILVISAAIMLMGFWFSRVIIGEQQKERTIAFENPTGRVTVSLAALEDMIKRTVLRVPDVKEVKAAARATKRGIDIACRLVLKLESHIPDMTSRIQDLVKSRIQEILGLEENVFVKIHIAKIVTQLDKGDSHSTGSEKDAEALNVPFQGYRK